MEAYPLRERHNLRQDALLFLCPASIRPVKGVLELLELFDPLRQEKCQRWDVLFCGPELDGSYSRNFLAALDARPWAHYLGVLPPASMGDILNQVDVVVNNSVSEGMPNALIEAAVLGRPILAHDIPGNRPVVEDGANGLLYADAAEFHTLVASLLSDPELRHRLSHPQPERYAPTREAQALHALCRSLKRLNSV
jgi:glycosyltransferase involved in cell wall biosynthesis